MRVTDEGLALIRRFEGFRSRAYRDAVGVWTIGYGHTSMAGPPDVKQGLAITPDEGAAILARDVQLFAKGVRERVTVELSDRQFSALVSFAFNVGLGAFAGSSVLKAVNANDLEAVPRRLNLWVKAGGRVLPGLVRRRAAEGALFAADNSLAEAPGQKPVQPKASKHPAQSKTLWAALAAALSAALASVSAAKWLWLFCFVVIGAAALIAFERYRKMKEEGL
jgi:lysozyme